MDHESSVTADSMLTRPRLCAVAVDVRSAHNIGSLFRTCDGFAAELYLVGISPRPQQPDDTRLPHIAARAHKAIEKTALGAEMTVSCRYSTSLAECVARLKGEGFDIFAIEQDANSRSITELKLQRDTALVLGPEVAGLSKADLQLCDELYEIPMHGEKESFNVSVSAAIALYKACEPYL